MLSGPDQIAVAEHHPFGSAGGPRGVDEGCQARRLQRRHAVPIGALIRGPAKPEDFLVADHFRPGVGGGVDHHDPPQLWKLAAKGLDQIEIALVLHQHQLRLAVRSDVLDLLRAARRVQPDRQPAQRHRGELGDDPLLPVEAQDGQRPASAKAQLAKA